jgi:3-oxoadipate enol-lactonase
MSVLLIHGVGGRPRSWDAVLEHLDPALRGQVVAVDATAEVGQTMSDMAHRLLDRHPGRHVLVGHSFGGMLAQEAALADSTRVAAVLLVNSIPGATSRVSEINRNLANDIETHGLAEVAPRFGRGLFAPGRLEREPELEAKFVADMLEAGLSSVCAALRAIADWDASDRLHTLRCPAAVLAGDAEADLKRQAELARLVGGTFEILSNTGHLAPLEAPAEVARSIATFVGGA